MRTIIGGALLALTLGVTAGAQTHSVSGYTRANGTYARRRRTSRRTRAMDPQVRRSGAATPIQRTTRSAATPARVEPT